MSVNSDNNGADGQQSVIDRRAGSVMERHTQTLLTGVALALLLWVGLTLNENSKTIARMDQRLISVEKQLGEVKAASQGNYTRREAEQDRRRMEFSIQKLSERVRALESSELRRMDIKHE